MRLLVFAGLLLVVRGLPSLVIYLRLLPFRQRLEMTFITATTMPLLIALAEIGLKDGVMLPANAAALVGAGVISVLLFPAIAAVLHRKDQPLPDIGEPAPSPQPSPRTGRARRPDSGPGSRTTPCPAPAAPIPACRRPDRRLRGTRHRAAAVLAGPGQLELVDPLRAATNAASVPSVSSASRFRSSAATSTW